MQKTRPNHILKKVFENNDFPEIKEYDLFSYKQKNISNYHIYISDSFIEESFSSKSIKKLLSVEIKENLWKNRENITDKTIVEQLKEINKKSIEVLKNCDNIGTVKSLITLATVSCNLIFLFEKKQEHVSGNAWERYNERELAFLKKLQRNEEI